MGRPGMTVWVRETRDGVETGNQVGFPDRIAAGAYVEKMRQARDMDLCWIPYRDQKVDWKIRNEEPVPFHHRPFAECR
jgi:hypothetical protein